MSLWDQLSGFLAQNDLARSGMFLGVAAGVAVYLRKLPRAIFEFVLRRATRSIEVRSEERLFFLVLATISKKAAFNGRRWQVSMLRSQKNGEYDENATLSLVRAPASGLSTFRYLGARFVMLRSEEPSQYTAVKERAIISTMWWNVAKLESLLREAVERDIPDFGRAKVFFYDAFNVRWRDSRDVRLRSMSSVILPDSIKGRLLRDARRFLESRERYEELGIPHHRGYLLHGAPGNGKTSLVSALACELGLDLYILHLDGLNDQKLLQAIGEMSARGLLVIEDVDCLNAAVDRDRDKDDHVTTAGILNALDGLATPDGQVVVLTTNCPEKLDVALLRPGRIDLSLEVSCPGPEEIAMVHDRFFPHRPERSREFVREMAGASMAEVQGRLQQMEEVP